MGFKQKVKDVVKRVPYSHAVYHVLRRSKQGYREGGAKRAISSVRGLRFVNAASPRFLDHVFQKARLDLASGSRFVYSIDENLLTAAPLPAVSNFTLDYSWIVDYSLKELHESAAKPLRAAARSLERCAALVCERLRESGASEKSVSCFERMQSEKAHTLADALQRILFINQIAWQTGHRLCGLGRLDKILARFEDHTRQTDDDLLIRDFLTTLHRYYHFKSNTLPGDTGQIIVLGGLDESGEYFYNSFTELFLRAVAELKLPDPKILLRISRSMPDSLLRLALESLSAATGSPLFSNDDVVIPALTCFGYDPADAHAYCASACWEPFIPGKALDPNNAASLNYIRPLLRVMGSGGKDTAFDTLFADYKAELIVEAEAAAKKLDGTRFRKDPFVSLFYEPCRSSGKDISQWGAKYNNFGVTAVGMPNLINSLARIKGEGYRFGDDEAAGLVNEITKTVSDYYASRKNKFPGKIKFGLSSPSYLSEGKNAPATPDGRGAGEPFSTHISADGLVMTQLVRFAGMLEYSDNRFNGNVVDFFLPPRFIYDHMEKLLSFMKAAIKIGFFQMQMNIMDYDTLIAAKERPEEFKTLIVRVWGFSAYFVELPEEYQNLLIERARVNVNA